MAALRSHTARRRFKAAELRDARRMYEQHLITAAVSRFLTVGLARHAACVEARMRAQAARLLRELTLVRPYALRWRKRVAAGHAARGVACWPARGWAGIADQSEQRRTAVARALDRSAATALSWHGAPERSAGFGTASHERTQGGAHAAPVVPMRGRHNVGTAPIITTAAELLTGVLPAAVHESADSPWALLPRARQRTQARRPDHLLV